MRATLHTTMGDIAVTLYADATPETVANFVGLAEGTKTYTGPNASGGMSGPFYDGCIIHHVVRDFIIQTGDPTGSGRGGPGYDMPDEIVDGLRFDRPFLLAAAGEGPRSLGSQFFITLRGDDMEHLDGDYTIFGEVADEPSRDVVRAVNAVPAVGFFPICPVTIHRISIDKDQ